jgi:processive 1,2-diacylglycerol beta-glucosyltransferase
MGDSVRLVRLASRLASPKVRGNITKYISNTRPDIIVSVFPTWNPLISKLYKQSFPNRKFLVVVTDLIYAQGAWVAAPETDAVIVGNPETKSHLEAFAEHKGSIKVLGYPTQPILQETIERGPVLSKLGLDPTAFTVLYLVSVEASEEVQATITQLETQFPDDNIIVAAGRNEALLAKLSTKRPEHTALVGWTDAMPDFLRACDTVVSKAGGASVMECMTLGRPMVITRAVTGEEGNAEIVRKYGYGIVLENHEASTIGNGVASIKSDYTAYSNRLKTFPYRNATDTIAHYIIGQLSAKS